MGFVDGIDPDVLSSVQCNTTLKCLNCAINGLDMNLDECISTVSFNGIPNGSNISIDTRISTSCGEEFFLSPAYYTYIGMLFCQCLCHFDHIYFYNKRRQSQKQTFCTNDVSCVFETPTISKTCLTFTALYNKETRTSFGPSSPAHAIIYSCNQNVVRLYVTSLKTQ